jgi:hypothetical protein
MIQFMAFGNPEKKIMSTIGLNETNAELTFG